MNEKRATKALGLFVLISFLFSWVLFFFGDLWLEPMFAQRCETAAAKLSVLIGHTLAMLGPALAALLLWRFVRKEEPPAWEWSRPKYYLWAALAMLAMWTVPGGIGLLFGDSIVSPIPEYVWIAIAVELAFGWISGMGEETGWCAYLLTLLAPKAGKTRAAVISGALRGLWHWPVLVSPVILQVALGERTPLELAGAGVVIALQLTLGNILFGSVLGWIWYRTESIPLVGWTHYWHNLTRDVTIMLLVGYGSGLWAASWSGLIPMILGIALLDRMRRSENLGWRQVVGLSKGQRTKGAAEPGGVGPGTHIALTRHPEFADMMQAYKVLIDGVEAASIRDGESIAVPVSAGTHTLHLTMDWCRCRPVEFAVREGECVRFECGNHLGGWRVIFAPVYLTLLSGRYMWIRRIE
ncbi:MAG: CPBP family intramembrane metalloprotease [Anaerolineales bacterium]|nr:CPBP family intramembrane metalloprotease [Anaerolineales bacterium]